MVFSEMRFLTGSELDLLALELDERYQVLILSAGYTGLRWSELVALTLDDVQLPAGVLSVSHTLTEVNGRFFEGPPKTLKGTRTFAIPRFLAQAIGEHTGRFPAPGGRVFSAPAGGPLRKSFGRRVFRPAVDRAGLAPLRFHDLRHTAAGLMIARGTPVSKIQKVLGHSSAKVTLDIYGHIMPDEDAALANGLDEIARVSAASAPLAARGALAMAGRR
jgi:integrase